MYAMRKYDKVQQIEIEYYRQIENKSEANEMYSLITPARELV